MQQQQQQQRQYSAVKKQPQQQRVMKYSSRQEQTQPLVANSTRPPARVNNKKSTANDFQKQQKTPISNYRQQPPSVRQVSNTKNAGTKKNHGTTCKLSKRFHFMN